MTKMSKIYRGIVPAPRRVMLYGTHGIGKSSFAAQSPNPIFIQTEDGLGNIDCAKFPLALSFDDVRDALMELYSEDHSFQTVVIDSLDWLERLIFMKVCQHRNVESIEDIGFAKGYIYALDFWREIMAGLEALREKKDMMIILLAHCKIEKFDNPAGDSYNYYCPQINKHASLIIQQWVDEVLFATYKVNTVQTDEGFKRKKTRAVGDGDRVIRTTARPYHLAKNRLNLPDEIELDWNVFSHYFNFNGKVQNNG